MNLNERDLDFLSALAGGESALAYARRTHYSIGWAKWKSQEIRRKLGVSTIQEAITVSENAGLAEAISELRKTFSTAIDDLKAAVTPAEKRGAGDAVQDAQAALTAELRARGLKLSDLDALGEAKAEERILAVIEKRDQAKAAADEAERLAAEAEDNGGEDSESDLGTKIKDGLGGLRNLGR